MNLKLVREFNSAITAHIIKNRLEDEGIECFIADENIVSVDPLLNFAVGGVKLRVREEDFARAKEILNNIEEQPYTNDSDEVIRCPNCSSSNIITDFKSNKSAGGIIATIASFLFGVLPIYAKSVDKCRDCNTEFQRKSKT